MSIQTPRRAILFYGNGINMIYYKNNTGLFVPVNQINKLGANVATGISSLCLLSTVQSVALELSLL